MNEAPSARAPDVPPPPDDPGVDLPTALLRGSLRVAQRRAAGILLAAMGFATGLAVLTIGSVAAAWDTPYRWLVLLGVAGFYLLLGGVGVWLLLQPIDDPDLRASQQKLAALQQRVRQFTDHITGEDAAGSTLAGFRPRSHTMRWIASLGSLPIPWARLVQSLLLWRSMRRRR
ncbi:MAG: hypothetical protein QM696_00010 [Steroidobacteraceae bacterium]